MVRYPPPWLLVVSATSHDRVMTPRERRVLGAADHACSLCGNDTVVLVESRNVRRLRDRLSTRWDARVRVAEACSHCGARAVLDGSTSTPGRRAG